MRIAPPFIGQTFGLWTERFRGFEGRERGSGWVEPVWNVQIIGWFTCEEWYRKLHCWNSRPVDLRRRRRGLGCHGLVGGAV